MLIENDGLRETVIRGGREYISLNHNPVSEKKHYSNLAAALSKTCIYQRHKEAEDDDEDSTRRVRFQLDDESTADAADEAAAESAEATIENGDNDADVAAAADEPEVQQTPETIYADDPRSANGPSEPVESWMSVAGIDDDEQIVQETDNCANACDDKPSGDADSCANGGQPPKRDSLAPDSENSEGSATEVEKSTVAENSSTCANKSHLKTDSAVDDDEEASKNSHSSPVTTKCVDDHVKSRSRKNKSTSKERKSPTDGQHDHSPVNGGKPTRNRSSSRSRQSKSSMHSISKSSVVDSSSGSTGRPNSRASSTAVNPTKSKKKSQKQPQQQQQQTKNSNKTRK